MEKWIRPRFSPCKPLGDNDSKITASEKHINLSYDAALESAVLLKNNNNILPLKNGQKVAVFGKAQIDYVKGGGGSGDVTVSYVRNIYDGLKLKKDRVEVLDSLSLFYREYVNEQYKNGVRTGMLEEPVIPDDLLNKAKKFSDTAIICINRYSLEGYDRKNDNTDIYYDLTDTERKMVSSVCDNFKHIIVLLNSGSMIDTSWFADNDRIEAAFMLWQAGMEGGRAAADLLFGDANPSGKLVDTFAKSFDDYPSSATFHESDDYAKYTEDVFVGYRYFETVLDKKECVVYPFGYGLSYTEFRIDNTFAVGDGKRIYVYADVKNVGNRSGKEVIQLYYRSPKGQIAKPEIELAAFQKTPLLNPGETYRASLSFEIRDMAVFDDMGTIEKSAYVMEKGVYEFLIGNSVRNTEPLAYKYELYENRVIEKLSSFCKPVNLGKRMVSDGSYIEVSDDVLSTRTFPTDYICEYHEPEDKEHRIQLIDVANGKVTLDEFLSQLSDGELLSLVYGKPVTGVSDTGGMGGLEECGIPNVMTADGPAGVRIMPNRQVYTTAFPVATALACTWNTELIEAVGKAGALEAKENNLLIWLTPALNIHRSPLCGRNFEYYSEDPLIAGKMAAAMVRGIQSVKVAAVPKHFACNNKETNRMFTDSILSERALREIYLKGFEICVKEAAPKIIMTSYNIINSVRASQNPELIIGILRNEWGYKGMVTTDWGNLGNHTSEIKAGSDIRMPITDTDKLQSDFDSGVLTRNEVAFCAKHILEMILWLE